MSEIACLRQLRLRQTNSLRFFPDSFLTQTASREHNFGIPPLRQELKTVSNRWKPKAKYLSLPLFEREANELSRAATINGQLRTLFIKQRKSTTTRKEDINAPNKCYRTRHQAGS
jgi:ribosomal protein L30/L7E